MTTQFLTREGGRIAYDDTGGAGPLVVCLPGWATGGSCSAGSPRIWSTPDIEW